MNVLKQEISIKNALKYKNFIKNALKNVLKEKEVI